MDMTLISGPAVAARASSNARVYVVDDDAEVRKSLHFLLATSSIQTWPFAGGDDFIEQLADLEAAPILLDIRMPVIDGFGVIAELAARSISWPVIVMTAHGDIPAAVRAMKQGAIEFIEKPFSVEDLEAAVMRGLEIVAADEMVREREAAARDRVRKLTPREDEVIRELLTGAANKVVAYRLGLSTRTIEMHRASALNKLGLKSLAGVASLFAALGNMPLAG
ncbi:DNA-binding response regulator [Sphingomonas koreensis]|nr:DNA-binding response regulator [Sphingomonas koreensis]